LGFDLVSLLRPYVHIKQSIHYIHMVVHTPQKRLRTPASAR